MEVDNNYKMSAERLAELKQELQYLQTVRVKEAAELIKEARSFGDLSENSEYDEAMTEQARLYSKINELKELIDKAQVVEMEATAGKVGHGSKVKVRDLETETEELIFLVGSQEANPMQGLVSSDSPLGRGLMGHSVGEVVTVEAPAGSFSYEIVEIEN